MKRILSFIMALAISLGTLSMVGCNLGTQTQFGDGDDVILNFNLYDLGYGTQWLDESCDRFMELYKDKEYGTKKGVYCRINKGNMDKPAQYPDSNNHIFSDGGFAPDAADTGNLLCVDDLVRADVYTDGAYTSIEDRLIESTKKGFQGRDGKYYGTPSYQSTTGCSYDKHLFDKYGLYFARPDAEDVIEIECEELNGVYLENGDPLTYYFVDNSVDGWEANKSCGPDGKFDTLDDGLPSSLFEFIALCSVMASDYDIQPMQVAGQSDMLAIYGNVFMDGLVFSLLGDRAETTRTLNGEVEVVVSFDGTDTTSYNGRPLNYTPIAPNLDYIHKAVTKTINVTEETGFYNMWSMERYYAMAMMEILKNEGWMGEGSTPVGGLTHLTAQSKFLHSGYRNMIGEQPEVGMLMESSYWYNESNIRGNLENFYLYNSEVEDREVRTMPLPVNIANSVTGEQGKTATLCGFTESVEGEQNVMAQSALNTFLFNKNIEKDPEVYEAFVDWLYFFYSEEEIANVTVSQGMTRNYKFEMPEDRISEWAGFYQHLYKLEQESRIIWQVSDSETYMRGGLVKAWDLGEGGLFFTCCSGNFGAALLNNKHGARQGFLDMRERYTPETWKTTYYKGNNKDAVKYALDENDKEINYVKPDFDVV